MRLRQNFLDHFGLDDGDECATMFGSADMCFFSVGWEPGVGMAAPFLVPNWAVYVPMDRFAEAMPWISQHRGDHDVLMHPNTGCFAADHLHWPMSSGDRPPPLLVNRDFFGAYDMHAVTDAVAEPFADAPPPAALVSWPTPLYVAMLVAVAVGIAVASPRFSTSSAAERPAAEQLAAVEMGDVAKGAS